MNETSLSTVRSPTRFRKLRIAWAVVCAIACVLLCALWVRSYWWMDGVGGDYRGRFTSIGSDSGTINYLSTRALVGLVGIGPGFHSFPVTAKSGSEEESSDDESDTAYRFLGFEWNWFADGVIASVPFWFAVLIAAIFAAVPWLRWRFSLRTLLIATTLVAVMLGLIVWAAKS